eukprot:s4614_g5.t1
MTEDGRWCRSKVPARTGQEPKRGETKSIEQDLKCISASLSSRRGGEAKRKSQGEGGEPESSTPIRGKSTGVFVEKPYRPGKVFKLRDVRTSKDVPRASSADEHSNSRDHTPSHGQGVDRSGMGREASPYRGSPSKEPPREPPRDRDHRGRPDGRDYRDYRDSPYDPRDPRDRGSSGDYGRDRRDRLRDPRDPQPWRSSHDVADFRREYAPPQTQTLSVDPIHFRDHRDRPDHWDYPFDPRDPSPMRRTANSSFDAVDFRGSLGESRSASREPSGYAGFARMPSIEVSHGLEMLNSQQMDAMRGKAPPPFDPADEFKSWLRSALQHERESVLEVMKGRHSEILSQFNYKLEEPKPPAHQPVHMTLTVKDRTVANAEKLSAHPPMPGVLVVNEDWAPGASSLRTPEKGGKKVVLGDDTDAKPSFVSDGSDNEPVRPVRTNSKAFGSEDTWPIGRGERLLGHGPVLLPHSASCCGTCGCVLLVMLTEANWANADAFLSHTGETGPKGDVGKCYW